jgi:AAHS family 4-hydroxybenzoate transporter-like MFS transporter
MAAATDVQVSHFLNEYGVGPFHIKLIIWSTVIAFIDGYDIGAIAFAAPSLIKEWHVAPKDLGVVLSAAILACCSVRRFLVGSAIVMAARRP